MAKEIEILYELAQDIESVKEKLKVAEYIGNYVVRDTYYFDPLRDQLQPDEYNKLSACLRVRERGDEYMLTYKNDHFDNEIWTYSDELETSVGSKEIATQILENIGYQVLVNVNVDRHFYHYREYEITLEEVEGLGNYLEVEYKNGDEDADVAVVRTEIRKSVLELGLQVGDEQTAGKPELILNKNRNENPSFKD